MVGAGFAGLVMLHRLRGLGFSARVFEAGSGIGGTWYWNRYPGARCDIESLEYSYQFSEELQQEWEWSERYATQPEILRYIEHVADRFDLRRDIQLDTRVRAAHWSDAESRWAIETERGSYHGALPDHGDRLPVFRERARLPGPRFVRGHDLSHRALAARRRRLHRPARRGDRHRIVGDPVDPADRRAGRPPHRLPAHAELFDPGAQRPARSRGRARGEGRLRGLPPAQRRAAVRRQLPAEPGARHPGRTPPSATASTKQRWQIGGLGFITAFGDLLFDRNANQTAAEFVREKIREIVRDPAVAEKLSPKQVIGCKRLCVDTGYYATFNRPNVSLVDVSETPIEAITPRGVRVAGVEYEVDAIVFATGFDAMTGALLAVDIRGTGGRPLREKWAAGPRTYLGVGTAGFPNLFIITGPGSPSVLANMVPAVEQHADWIADCLAYLREHGIARIDAQSAAEDAWVGHVNDVANLTVFPSCNSWYLGANVPGKPRVFMPYIGFPTYVAKCNEVAAKGYEGFELS